MSQLVLSQHVWFLTVGTYSLQSLWESDSVDVKGTPGRGRAGELGRTLVHLETGVLKKAET